MHTHPHHDNESVGRVITRRQALGLFTAPFILSLAGCSPSEATNAGAALTGSCVVRPQLTAGPFYVDTDLLRSDIREDRAGALLTLTFTVSQIIADECQMLEGAVVDVWHADAGGDYSGVGSLGEARFLRGIQRTDASGTAAFTTIYPGWYPGRTPHIHFKVRSSADSSSTYEFTSQLFFDDDLSRRVYEQAPYGERGAQNTMNARDGIYARSGSELLLDVTEADEGYAATFNIALYVD